MNGSEHVCSSTWFQSEPELDLEKTLMLPVNFFLSNVILSRHLMMPICKTCSNNNIVITMSLKTLKVFHIQM